MERVPNEQILKRIGQEGERMGRRFQHRILVSQPNMIKMQLHNKHSTEKQRTEGRGSKWFC